MANENFILVDSVDVYNKTFGLDTLHPLEFVRFLASPRHSSSKLGSALGLHINWKLSD